MQSWLVDMSRGRRALSRHEPLRALRYFERALIRVAPEHRSPADRRPARRADLTALHGAIAASARKAGMRNRAFACLVESARLRKRGHARRKLRRSTNEYGMARQSTPELDDQHAFLGLQMARYIRSKKSHKLGTRAEVDMVVELIREYWDRIAASSLTDELDYDQRLALFRDTTIVFPFLSVPSDFKTSDVAVNFGSGARLSASDRCICGSGLPYSICHGRTPGIDEILTGKF